MEGRRAALAGAVVAPLTLGTLVSLPFLASLALPRGDAPSPITEWLVEYWRLEMFLGGTLWGSALGSIVGANVMRMSAAGLGAVALGEVILWPIGQLLAPLFVDRPSHVEMAVTFPLAVAVFIAVMGAAFALAARDTRRLRALTLGCAGAAVLSAVAMVIGLDAVGVTTGTGDLAMPKVFVLGTLAACAAAGAAQGAALSATGGRPLRA